MLQDAPWIGYLVDGVGYVAPIIGKIDNRTAAHPDAVRLFLAVTILLLLPKTIALYRWLSKGRNSSLGRQLIVSPLTDKHAERLGDYIAEPMRGDRASVRQRQRSWLSRIFWSLMIFAFTAASAFALLHSRSPDSHDSDVHNYFLNLGREGILIWYVWSLKQMTFLSLLLSVSAMVGRDYIFFINQLISNYVTRRSS